MHRGGWKGGVVGCWTVRCAMGQCAWSEISEEAGDVVEKSRMMGDGKIVVMGEKEIGGYG